MSENKGVPGGPRPEPDDDTEGNHLSFSDQNVKDNVAPVAWSAESDDDKNADDAEGHRMM